MQTSLLSHLSQLEAESIHIIREVAAEFENPVMLYSAGKDSSVMLHLALKAFYPALPPFPLLHVDTTWKFREMIEFRDELRTKLGIKMLVHINQEGVKAGLDPFSHDSGNYTDVMKTLGLKQALNHYGFDAAMGGARRDEERSRAKERVFSFRNDEHMWNPSDQRPELWNIYNTRINPTESIRAFPLSNWTELDVWEYILVKKIDVVSLYFAKARAVVDIDGTKILVDDERMPAELRKKAKEEFVRFRTLGCYPLSGAVSSTAKSVSEVITEIKGAKNSERQGRLIDVDSLGSMEQKKRKGYF
ncbi:sulfate adenylyltransferase subunit CysD [OM182 bacterium]|nr:sulfate adenylyltransferase subunit CysD [OM182 bacterium]